MKISLTMTLKNRKLLTPGTIPPDRQAIRTPPPPPTHTLVWGWLRPWPYWLCTPCILIMMMFSIFDTLLNWTPPKSRNTSLFNLYHTSQLKHLNYPLFVTLRTVWFFMQYYLLNINHGVHNRPKPFKTKNNLACSVTWHVHRKWMPPEDTV
jgi:hypothetical protein